MSAEERLPVGAYVASALMAANIPCDSGEDVDRFLNEMASRGYAVVPASVMSDSYVCPACGGGWWTVGDDSYACNHSAGVSVPTEPVTEAEALGEAWYAYEARVRDIDASVPTEPGTRPSVTWKGADRTAVVLMAPIVDGLCSGCGTKPTRETGSCRCLFRVDDVIRGKA